MLCRHMGPSITAMCAPHHPSRILDNHTHLLIEQPAGGQHRIEAAEREKRLKERQAAKLLRKRQLADLRAKAVSRATGEEWRKVERDKEAEERKRWEEEELKRMRREEAAQLAGGDR